MQTGLGIVAAFQSEAEGHGPLRAPLRLGEAYTVCNIPIFGTDDDGDLRRLGDVFAGFQSLDAVVRQLRILSLPDTNIGIQVSRR